MNVYELKRFLDTIPDDVVVLREDVSNRTGYEEMSRPVIQSDVKVIEWNSETKAFDKVTQYGIALIF